MTLEGRQISHYRVTRRIGSGGMGVVYEAEDLTLGRRVALKFLPPGLKETPQAAERFKMEARSASALNHPNICTIYEVGEENGELFIAMELLQGDTLEHLLQHHDLPVAQIIDIAIGVADGLDAAHTHGMVHRDIKPANIFITTRGVAKILDFGLAKTATERVGHRRTDEVTGASTVAHLTSPGVALGTVAFMSPEQARGEALDARSDLFSFGAVLYQTATRQLPFAGETSAVIFDGILNRDPIPAIERNPALPPRLGEIIHAALEKDKELRYQSAAEIRAELKRLKRASGSARTPANHDSGRAPASTPESQRASTAHTVPAATPNRRRVWIGAAAAVLVLGAAAGYVLVPSSDPPPAALNVGSLEIERLTQTGRVIAAAISPDGRYIAYAQTDGPQQSLWVRQIATRSDVQVLPGDQVRYVSVSFSRDGNYLYFGRSDRSTFNYSYLYSVPVLGGTPRMLVKDVDTPVTFSPDGSRMAYVRGLPDAGRLLLLTAKADGTDEKVLWKTASELRGILGADWSPDGRSIAIPFGDRAVLNTGAIMIVDAASGTATRLLRHDGRLGRPRWRPDGAGLIVPLDNRLGDRAQLWYVTYPEGRLTRFTNDLSDYSRQQFDMTADGKVLAIIEEVPDRNLEVMNLATGATTPITTGGKSRTMSWGSDGSVYYAMTPHIFRTDRAVSVQQQLTTEGTINEFPAACGDGSVLFIRHEGEQSSIWRMDSDGGNPRVVLRAGGVFAADCSPDGKWLVYGQFREGPTSLTRIAMDGSSPVPLLQGITGGAVRISPDGSRVASAVWPEDVTAAAELHVVPASGGPKTHVIAMPASVAGQFAWAPDGKAVQYVLARNGTTNVWEQPLDGGPLRQVTRFTSRDLLDFVWSPDGKDLLVARGGLLTDVVALKNFQ